GAEEGRARARVGRVVLRRRRRDRLRLARTREGQLDPLRLEQVRQPLPPKRGLERDPRPPRPAPRRSPATPPGRSSPDATATPAPPRRRRQRASSSDADQCRHTARRSPFPELTTPA